MDTPSVSFAGSVLDIDGERSRLSFPISQVAVVGPIVVVLFDPDSFTGTGQFNNLLGVDARGRILWTAELPTSQSGDRFYRIASNEPLVVYSVYSFECEIDPGTGRIVRRTFFR